MRKESYEGKLSDELVSFYDNHVEVTEVKTFRQMLVDYTGSRTLLADESIDDQE